MSNNFEYEENLENIARTYHLGGQQDMYIEEAGQEFEWPWIAQRIKEKSRILDLGYGDGHSFNNLKKRCRGKGLANYFSRRSFVAGNHSPNECIRKNKG